MIFGDDPAPLALSVTLRDLRCMMINLDPDTGEHDARVMRATTQLNDNHAGIYATTVRTGAIRRGDQVRLDP